MKYISSNKFVECCNFCYTGVTQLNSEKLGDFFQIALPAVGFLATLAQRDTRGFAILLGSTLITSAISHAAKQIFNYTSLGKRPNGKSGSFPSAHTSSAFSGAAFLTSYYNLRVGGLASYLCASFTAFSRVQANKHHNCDVIVGGILGSIVSCMMANYYAHSEISI